jgi:hypothetical protein
MGRAAQALRSGPSRKQTNKSAAVGGSITAKTLSTPIGLYGHSAWEVCLEVGSVSKLASAPISATSRDEALRKPVLQTGSKGTARRRRERWRDRGLFVPATNPPAEEVRTDFSFVIGIAGAVAFEAITLSAIVAVWYGVSALSAVVSL